MELEKVEEPNVNDSWQCARCQESHCGDCVDYHKVEFDIIDKRDGNPDNPPIQWMGLNVCPWCFNQLLAKYKKEMPGEE